MTSWTSWVKCSLTGVGSQPTHSWCHIRNRFDCTYEMTSMTLSFIVLNRYNHSFVSTPALVQYEGNKVFMYFTVHICETVLTYQTKNTERPLWMLSYRIKFLSLGLGVRLRRIPTSRTRVFLRRPSVSISEGGVGRHPIAYVSITAAGASLS